VRAKPEPILCRSEGLNGVRVKESRKASVCEFRYFVVASPGPVLFLGSLHMELENERDPWTMRVQVVAYVQARHYAHNEGDLSIQKRFAIGCRACIRFLEGRPSLP
jgi:hypothetical protein